MAFGKVLQTSLFAFSFGLIVSFQCVSADEYVWARTNWGSSNINQRYGSMTNGYGGYYVPKNAAGNNYEAQGNFRNPNGYIIPANAGYGQQSTYSQQRRYFWQH